MAHPLLCAGVLAPTEWPKEHQMQCQLCPASRLQPPSLPASGIPCAQDEPDPDTHTAAPAVCLAQSFVLPPPLCTLIHTARSAISWHHCCHSSTHGRTSSASPGCRLHWLAGSAKQTGRKTDSSGIREAGTVGADDAPETTHLIHTMPPNAAAPDREEA
ncbi:hypothetical protein GQ54DRAFT_297117 [Martensiomyces pterosporus]|nr:hypothetical protein GQ54DRAFT_297117 [Martensiomyces pterosporus]